MTVIRALFNQNNEVYMVDTSGWTIKEKVVAVAANKKLFSCIVGRPGSDGAQACVISKRYWDISKGAGDVLDDGSVDVLVNVSISRTNSFDVDIPGDDTATGNDDVTFNVCQHASGQSEDFRNYRTLLHEAGHALGLSDFFHIRPFSSVVAHSRITDSVMNYNTDVGFSNYWGEPDCSPYPMDIMAIRTLYETTD